MTRTRFTAATLALLLAASGGPLAAAEQKIPETLNARAMPAYQAVDATLAVGGQPSAETVAKLGELGFRTVISLRLESEGPAEESPALEKQGVDFVRVPVSAGSFASADADAVAAVLDDPERAPVLLHCGSGDRVGAVLAVLAARKGKSAEEAEASGRKLGLRSPDMTAAVRKVIAAEQAAPRE